MITSVSNVILYVLMLHYRIYTSNFLGHLVNGAICKIGCKAALQTMMKTTQVMDQWQCFVQHALSQASIFPVIGRQDIHRMCSSTCQQCDFDSNLAINSFTHSLWMETSQQNT